MTNLCTRLSVTAVIMLAGVGWTAAVAAQEVAYTVAMPQLTTGLLHVTLDIRNVPDDTLEVAMPAWSPGGYGLHWASKNVQELWAEDGEGQGLDVVQVDTSRWRIHPVPSRVYVHYKVFVGQRAMDDSHARISGTRSLMYVVGQAPYPAGGPVTITVDGPDGWTFATGLDAIAPGVFTAPDYDTLIDSPIELAEHLDQFAFEDQGARYEIAIRNPHGYDRDLLRD